MGFVGGTLAAANSEQKECTVAGIDERVNAFGQHCGAAAKERGEKLRAGDHEISDDRGSDGFRCFLHQVLRMNCGAERFVAR